MADRRTALPATAAIMLGLCCAACGISPSGGADPPPASRELTCGGPSFHSDALEGLGNAETLDDPAAATLRRHLSGGEGLGVPRAGWYEAIRTDAMALYVAENPNSVEPAWVAVTVEGGGDGWQVTGWGSCILMVALAPGLGPATFRVDPEVELAPETTEIPVLVTERACNGGEDARGRIVAPVIEVGPEAVTVVFAVQPRGGEHNCPSNPETPFILVLPEPLGDRVLLDGSMVPARDATNCADPFLCP